jgi:uncharacterized protein
MTKTIWIDLDNSPHVPFFAPIVEELQKQGYTIVITARDCFQVCDLADLLHLPYKRIGRHHGKHVTLKLMGLMLRAGQLLPTALKSKPVLAVSHGSRAQLIAASVLRIPSMIIGDYEFSRLSAIIRPSCLMVPDVISEESVARFHCPVFKYPGIKEDVYAPRFRPDPGIKNELNLNGELLVTIRPPATEAHYHVPESDALFEEVVKFLSEHPDVHMVMLPRNARQEHEIRNRHAELFHKGKITIPDHVVNGLNLVWHSDLVVSGGGTMNREAAALGVPVYSIFRGKTGAVDRYLADSGRMTLLQSREDVRSKLMLVRRSLAFKPKAAANAALPSIVGHIVNIMEGNCQPR